MHPHITDAGQVRNCRGAAACCVTWRRRTSSSSPFSGIVSFPRPADTLDSARSAKPRSSTCRMPEMRGTEASCRRVFFGNTTQERRVLFKLRMIEAQLARPVVPPS